MEESEEEQPSEDKEDGAEGGEGGEGDGTGKFLFSFRRNLQFLEIS